MFKTLIMFSIVMCNLQIYYNNYINVLFANQYKLVVNIVCMFCVVNCRSSSSQCKCLEFSPSGETCAWCDGTSLKVYNVVENKLLHDIELSSVGYLTFSPSGSMLATWQVFTGEIIMLASHLAGVYRRDYYL